MEGTLSFVIDMRRQGTCLVSGNVRDNTRGHLNFNFDSDQTFLWRAVEDLESIGRQFPIRNADKEMGG
jgi:hypothetical protein